MVAGNYDGWVRQSLEQLAVLMPGRYAKAEISSGLIGPVEVFAYRAPGAEVVLPADTEVSQPSAGEGGPENPDNAGGLDVSAVF